MPFFQNVFLSDFEGNWVLGDRHHSPKFVAPGNKGRGDERVVSWAEGPYDLSGVDADGTNSTDTLEIVYALRDSKNWATLSVDVAAGAAVATAVTSQEIADNLNGNVLFAERFQAEVKRIAPADVRTHIHIRQKRPITEFRFYINKGRAEEVLQFNFKAGVAELPSYFARHTMANRFDYEDAQNHLIQLDPTTSDIDANIIDGAVDAKGNSLGLDSATVQEDWELLEGRSGIFQFTSGPGTGAVSTTTTTIIYPAGANAGDLAKKIVTQKNAGGLVVKEFEMPYTLEAADLITPP